MSGKFGTEEIKLIVGSVVVFESGALQIRDLQKNGGLLKWPKIIGVATTMLQAAQPLWSLDLAELKNEVTDLDATDDADVIAALTADLQQVNQATTVATAISDVLALVTRVVTTIQDIKKLLGL